MNVKEILIKARHILAERGVTRDGWFIDRDEGCKVCAVGALYLAAGGRVEGGDRNLSYFDETVGEERLCIFPDFDIVLIEADMSLAEEAEGVLQKALSLVSSDRVYAGMKNVRQFSDRSQSDEEVLALFDLAIASLP